MSKITGKEYPLKQIFSSKFEYHIPSYQRPYAWTEEETGILFEDLYSFYQSEYTDKDNYFLGSIVLIKEDDLPYADVIDGQQRLTTLTILLSVLCDAFSDPSHKSDCRTYLQDKGSEFEDIPAQPRLFLRKQEQSFFKTYIQDVHIKELLEKDSAQLDSEAKRHVQKNCGLLREQVNKTLLTEEARIGFIRFLLNRCYLVAVWTPDRASAFRVFSVMNSRGLDLLPTDIIKSETIGKLPETDQADYTETWESIENQTGRDGFNEVFTHTRTIFAKERAKKNLLEEFREFVLKNTTPQELIEQYLKPYASAYIQLKRCQYTATSHADEVNKLLIWLNRTGNYDWMPPAIKFLAEHQNDSEYVLWFVKKLERLASYLLATAKDVNRRVERYKWLLVEMEDRPQHSKEEPLKMIDLSATEIDEFLTALNGEIYEMTPIRRNYLLQRLDTFVSDGGAQYDTKLFTIEHVLPQNPDPDSQWLKDWPDEKERRSWLNRVGNLVPLSRQRNSAAQNYEFPIKKEKYFRSRKETSSYALTTQVLSYQSWTPKDVAERQKKLIADYCANWELEKTSQSDAEQPLQLAGRGASAKGFSKGNGSILVLAGSRISEEVVPSLQKNYLDLRRQLQENQVIVDGVFVQDYLFPSVSAAAAVILGRSANGRTEWALPDGRTYAQVGSQCM